MAVMTSSGILLSAGISVDQALDSEVGFYREPDSACSNKAQSMMGETDVHQMKCKQDLKCKQREARAGRFRYIHGARRSEKRKENKPPEPP